MYSNIPSYSTHTHTYVDTYYQLFLSLSQKLIIIIVITIIVRVKCRCNCNSNQDKKFIPTFIIQFPFYKFLVSFFYTFSNLLFFFSLDRRTYHKYLINSTKNAINQQKHTHTHIYTKQIQRAIFNFTRKLIENSLIS